MKAPAKKVAKPESVVEIIDDVEQGTEAWFALRLGLPTASNYAMVLRGSDSKTRDDYLRTLAGEILTGSPAESYKNSAMARGSEMEAEARDHYARTNFGELEQVGFIRRKLPSGRYTGASPDALLSKRSGALEIKTLLPKLMIDRLIKGAGMPTEHRAQVQGTMWVGDLDFVELILFYRGMPVVPKFKVGRDESFIKEISDSVEIFDWELDKLVKKIRGMGVPLIDQLRASVKP